MKSETMDCTLKVRDHGLRTKRLRLEVAHLKSETKGCTLKVRVQGLHTYNRDQGLLVLVPKLGIRFSWKGYP